jgi:hypothetical protein
MKSFYSLFALITLIFSSCGGGDQEPATEIKKQDTTEQASSPKSDPKFKKPIEIEYISAEYMNVIGAEEEELYTTCSYAGFNLRCSSTKKAEMDTAFRIENIGDNNRQTAWVEGAEGSGKGEYFEFDFIFDDTLARCRYYCDYFTILNGYQKNSYTYNSYSRVKRFKVYLDGTPFCYVDLLDTPGMQFFTLPYFKYLDRNGKATLRFEIEDVYPGSKEKKKETAITELFFSCQP